MKRLNLWLGPSILLPLFAASPAQAQRVSADVRIDGGPVAGRLFIGDWREWYRGRPRPVVVVPSRPIYGVGERSGMRLPLVVPAISWLLLKGFFWRLREKYVIRDFHPLVFFYFFGLVMSLAGLGLGIALIVLRILGHGITAATGVLVALLLIFGSQFTLFAMWFDMESNKDLR